MFLSIYLHEVKEWLRRPSFYIYLGIMFLIALLSGAANAGLFDNVSVTIGGISIVNAPLAIMEVFNGISETLFFLLPSLIGVTIHRDYKSGMDSLLYSYPFTKLDYLMGKFWSGFTMVSIIIVVTALGLMMGLRFPGTNPELLGPFRLDAYLHTYFVYIIPNMLLYGVISFAVVTFTRNITAGFITVIILVMIQGLLDSMISEQENRYIAGLLSPNGSLALDYYTRYWTVAEKNEQAIPLGTLVLLNRAIWFGIASIMFFFVYKKFEFSATPISLNLFKKKKQGARMTKRNFGGITRISLPKVNYDYSLFTYLKTTWKLSNIDFKYIIKAPPFLAILLVGILITFIAFEQVAQMKGTPLYPTTKTMLQVGFSGVALSIMIITYLYAGMLVNRSNMTKSNFLIDATPTPNWTLWFSKLIALFKVQLVLLTVVMLTGICYQVYKGYFTFEIGHYMFELYVLHFLRLMVLAMLSLLVQTLVRNPYLGLFLLFVINIGLSFVGYIGIEQRVFIFNKDVGFAYSDMNGYGSGLSTYFVYRLYWFFFGLLLLALTHLFWVRGFPASFKERLYIARKRLDQKMMGILGICLVLFVGVGARIYYEDNVKNRYISNKAREQKRVEWEKKYKQYEGKAQPRIVSVSVHLDLFPKTNDFKAHGTYKMINKTGQAIDSIFLEYNDYPSTFDFKNKATLVSKDSIFQFDIYRLKKPLQPGESLVLDFTVKNKPNSIFRNNSPVLNNGTFINNFELFPSLGYSPSKELTDNVVRKKYGLGPNNLRPHPSDTTALGNTYISRDSDWIDFEAFVSTDEDQIAIAPGYLQKEYVKDGRKYYHYKMDSKILNFYAFNAGVYEVKRDKWKDVKIEIYYHKGHDYNIDGMIKGIKASLTYNSKYFSPYQHKQVRIIEFPSTKGSFAQSFPNTIPFSESVGFIADVDLERDNGLDFNFAVTVHELAHQWWAHQVIGADVLGATMLSESLAEYVALKVLEHQQGKKEMRKFLKKSLDEYLSARSMERKREKALMYNDGQGYVRYQKGSLIFYALSDYIGEERLNGALKSYLNKVKFQSPPYTTSIEMVDEIRKVVPDSLQYTIKDMFETVTLYDNSIVSAKATPLKDGKYRVDIEYLVRKYRKDEKGKTIYDNDKPISYKGPKIKKPLKSVALHDYIEVGIFAPSKKGKNTKVLYLKKIKVNKIDNKISIIVDQKPSEVGVDPYNKLIDDKSDDNRKGVEIP